MTGILLGLGILVSLFYFSAVPMINDITTEFPPPEFMVEDRPYDAGFYKLQAEYYPQIKSLVMVGNPADFFERSKELMINCYQWQVLYEEKPNQLEAVAKTEWLAFKDDVLVKLVPLGNKTKIIMRSRSRAGKSDFGANQIRIRLFMKSLVENKCYFAE